MRWPSVTAFFGATLCVWLFTWSVRWAAGKLRLVDRNERRNQVRYRAVPRIGGVAIATGFGLTVLGLNLLLSGPGGALGSPLVWLAACGVFGLGLLDDFRPVKAQYKLIGVLCAGALVAMAGYRIENVPFIDVRLGPISSIAATALWFGVIGTAWNFIDGLDGLASGLTIVASLAFWLGSWGPDVHVPAILAGAALGFLAHNRYPSTIFMGDSGSFFLGFWVALSGLITARGGQTSTASVSVLVALAWPLADMAWALLRRLRKVALFKASGDHLHYLLNERLGHRGAVQAALVIAGASGVASVLLACPTVAGGTMVFCLLCLWVFCGRVPIARPTLITVAAVCLWLVRTTDAHRETDAPEPLAGQPLEAPPSPAGVDSDRLLAPAEARASQR
jgi:UDP-GlcNAc:undecaprenyl-phosphate/decaprenyl-phosphate GlcNAc-1-phosphate transferase